MKIIFLFAVAGALLASSTAFAQTESCDALSSSAKELAQSVMSSNYLYDCCDDTIAKCLEATPRCELATRLADHVCRLASEGRKADEIARVLEHRSLTMSRSSAPAPIELRPEMVWGNAKSKVVISVYLCGRCPYCAKHVGKLMDRIESQGLEDKVALNLRLFPIKSHGESTPSALATEAAAQLGKGWPFLMKTYENLSTFSVDAQADWAVELGLDRAKFDALVEDPKTRAAVVASKKEGLTNGVESTPTFFINGRMIRGAFDAVTIVDMLEEELAATH